MIDTPSIPKTARQRILEAARVALARDGFEGITTRRIAEAAGVNIATLHYHFGSKEALLTEAIRFALTVVADRTFCAMQGAGTLDEALEAGFAAFWAIVRDQPGTIRLELTVRGFRDESARAAAAEIHAALTDSIAQLIRRFAPTEPPTGAAPIESVARFTVSAMDGILLTYYATRDEPRALDEFVLLKDHMLSMLATNQGNP